MTYLIGIDSGGTKTEGVAYDEAGVALKTVTKAFGNLLVDYDQGLKNIQETIAELIAGCGPECSQIVLGLAGVDGGGFKEQLRESLEQQFNLPITIINDAELAHLSILKGQDGILVIAGTGSVVIGCQDQDWQRVGGWGHLLGDGGSAYDIALQGVKLGLEEYDQNLEFSYLTKQVLAYFKADDVISVVKSFYQLNKGEVAALALVVAEAALKAPEAQAILEEAGRKLGQQVLMLSRKLAFDHQVVRVGINGSVIKKNNCVKAAFLEELKNNDLEVELIESTESNAKGAYYFNQKRMDE